MSYTRIKKENKLYDMLHINKLGIKIKEKDIKLKFYPVKKMDEILNICDVIVTKKEKKVKETDVIL